MHILKIKTSDEVFYAFDNLYDVYDKLNQTDRLGYLLFIKVIDVNIIQHKTARGEQNIRVREVITEDDAKIVRRRDIISVTKLEEVT